MQNNFISKTIKTFVTSLVISVFVFGSFYFLLSDSSTKSEESTKSTKKDTSTKLVIEEDSKEKNALDKSSIDVKKEVLGVTTTSQSDTKAQTGGMLAQISDTYNETIETTPTASLTTPSSNNMFSTTTTVPSVTYTSSKTATGVPATGNEGLYILMAAFSLVSGFLITNGKDLAMKNFEK